MEQRFRRQIPHNTNRNQQRETVATSITFRSNVGSAQPRDVFFQVDHKLETQTLFPYDCVGDTLRKPEPHRGGEITECSVGVATASRLQNWQTTSHVLFASPFFDTLAPVSHLDPRSSKTIWAQGAFAASPNQQSSFRWASKNKSVHTPDMEICDVGLGKMDEFPNLRLSAQQELFYSENAASHLPTNRCSRTAPCSVPQVPYQKTRFRSVFCCLGKSSGGVFEREEAGKLSFFTFKKKKTRVGLQEIGVRGRFQSWNVSNVEV